MFLVLYLAIFTNQNSYLSFKDSHLSILSVFPRDKFNTGKISKNSERLKQKSERTSPAFHYCPQCQGLVFIWYTMWFQFPYFPPNMILISFLWGSCFLPTWFPPVILISSIYVIHFSSQCDIYFDPMWFFFPPYATHFLLTSSYFNVCLNRIVFNPLFEVNWGSNSCLV